MGIVLAVSACERSPQAAASPAPVAPAPARASAESSGTAAAAPVGVPAAPAAATPLAQMHASMVDAMRPIVVGHAAMDGAVISDMHQVDACHTAFATSHGETTIAWAQVGNVAAHVSAGQREIALVTAGVTHTLTLPTAGYPQADAAGVDGAIGQMAGECGAY